LRRVLGIRERTRGPQWGGSTSLSPCHLVFTMLTACAWRDTPACATSVIAGLRQCLGGWLGIGRIVVGMARQGYDLQLTRYGEEGWRATFYSPIESAKLCGVEPKAYLLPGLARRPRHPGNRHPSSRRTGLPRHDGRNMSRLWRTALSTAGVVLVLSGALPFILAGASANRSMWAAVWLLSGALLISLAIFRRGTGGN
jgi:hypothetical protein